MFDIDRLHIEENELMEYIKYHLEKYMQCIIDDDTRNISIEILEKEIKFSSIELSIDIKILKNNVVENTVHFGKDNNCSLTIFSIITVPYSIKNEQRFLQEYAEDVIQNKYNYQCQYELERNDELNNREVILIETKKFGTRKYYNSQLNSYYLISKNDISNREPMIIMQEPSINIGKGTKEEGSFSF